MADGITGINQISGSLSARQIFGRVWTAAVEKAYLADPRVCPTLTLNKLRATIPLMGNLAVQSQLKEFEHSLVKNATPAGIDINLYKDRVKISVSDEATLDSDVGDPLAIQRGQAASELAANLEKLIAESLATTPQTYTPADWTSVSPLLTIGQMINQLRPYRASAVIMAPDVYAAYVAKLGNGIFLGGSAADLEKGFLTVPGYNIPVLSSTAWADASANTVAVVANDCPAVVLGQGGVKAREWDDPELGAKIYQYDVWRTPVSNLRQTDSNKNRGVITCVIST